MKTIIINRNKALAVILTVQLMLQMDFLIVMVSLKNIQADLGFTTAGLSWVPNAFALAFGGLLLLGGRLGDIIGQVKAFKIGIGIFVIASLAGGLASIPSILILARIFQGIGAALAGPSVLALITIISTTEAEKNKGLSLFIAVSSMGASTGLLLGGALTEFISWRWSLLINVPIGILALLIISRLVPETQKVKGKIDIAGALSGTIGSSALVYGFISAAENGWVSELTIGSFAIAIILFILFYGIEKRVKVPLLHLSFLRPRFRQGGLIVMSLIVGMHFATLFLLIQYFQQVLGFSPLVAGLAYVPLTIVVFTITQFMPGLIKYFGLRTLLVAGSVFVAVSLVGFSFITENSSYLGDVILPLLIHSIGIALVFTPGSIVIMSEVKDQEAGIASGVLQMAQQIGGAVGIAAIVTIYTAFHKSELFHVGLENAFISAAAICILTAIIALVAIPRRAK